MLLILIPGAWMVILLFALSVCRLAARSDESHDAALNERFAAAELARHELATSDPGAQPARDPELRVYRATG